MQRGNGNKAFLKGLAIAVVGGLIVNWIGEKMRAKKQGA